MNRGQKTILVLLSSGEDYSMQKFAGIQRYANRMGWHIQMVGYSERDGGAYRIERSPLGSGVSGLLEFWHPAGCIVDCGRFPELINPSEFGDCPTVFLDHHPKSSRGRTGYVFSDTESVAALAARELMYSGYGNYAYFPFVEDLDWSRGRGAAFARYIGINRKRMCERPGRNKMTVEDVRLFTEQLGIRTDLDLRMLLETGGLTESPLGAGVRYVQRESECYRGIFHRHGMKAMAENFRVFCNRENYPIYFHCRDGADRTGALAYVLNGILGVSRQELETDWESTFYPMVPDDNPDKGYWRRLSHLDQGFSKYGKNGDSWSRRIELYLQDCGVTEAEMRAFREIVLER